MPKYDRFKVIQGQRSVNSTNLFPFKIPFGIIDRQHHIKENDSFSGHFINLIRSKIDAQRNKDIRILFFYNDMHQ